MGRGRGATETLASAFVTLRGVSEDDPAALREAVAEASSEIAQALEEKPHFSQAEAADLLAVSKTTLDNWINRGLLPVVETEQYKRLRVPSKPLLELAAEVKELRRMGQKRGLLAEALSRLEQEDPEWRKEFADLYGDRAEVPVDRDDYVSAAPGKDWDPED